MIKQNGPDCSGTLWPEFPLFGQLAFLVDELKRRAPIEPETGSRTLWCKAALAADLAKIPNAAVRLEVPENAHDADLALVLGKECFEIIMHHVPDFLFVFAPSVIPTRRSR